MKVWSDDLKVEFPIISQDMMGYKNRYVYLSEFPNKTPSTLHGTQSVFFQGTVKFDLQEEKIVKKIKFGETKTCGEVFYHKKENAQSEDDGYLMTFLYDWETKTSEFVMWDAKTMSDEAVMRAPMNKRVPNGFHTYFVREEDLE